MRAGQKMSKSSINQMKEQKHITHKTGIKEKERRRPWLQTFYNIKTRIRCKPPESSYKKETSSVVLPQKNLRYSGFAIKHI